MIAVLVVAVAVAVAADAAAVDDDVMNLCLLRVHCLLNYHCHFYPPRHSYAQDENIVLKQYIFNQYNNIRKRPKMSKNKGRVIKIF